MKLAITFFISILCTTVMGQQVPIKKDDGSTASAAKTAGINAEVKRAPIKAGGGQMANKPAANAANKKPPIKTSDGVGSVSNTAATNTKAAQTQNTPSSTPVKQPKSN